MINTFWTEQFKMHKNDLKYLLPKDEDSNILSQHSSQEAIDQVEQAEKDFLFLHKFDQEQWNSGQNIENQLPRYNGPSVELSQSYSQNSMMMSSHRQDDDSREYKRDNRYLKVLQEKKKDQIQFNKALDKELTATQQQLDRKNLDINTLRGQIKGFQSKFNRQKVELQTYQKEIEELKDTVNQLMQEKFESLKVVQVKDEQFKLYMVEMNRKEERVRERQKENAHLKQEVQILTEEINQMSQNLAVYQQSDRHLLNFRGNYNHQTYESPVISKNNSNTQKQLEKLKKEKNSLEIELGSLRDKFEDRENRFRKVEEEHKKKLALKEKKMSQMELRTSDLREDHLKLKTQNQIALQKLTNNLQSKTKELNSASERIIESERRIKTLLDECFKKDEKNKEINQELLEKSKMIIKSQKKIQQLSIKLQFDQQMIDGKDQEIDKLFEERKVMRQQLQAVERLEKDQKDKTDSKTKRQLQKCKKEVDSLKKEIQVMRKEIQVIKRQRDAAKKDKQDIMSSRETKKKYDQTSKKLTQLKNKNIELEELIMAKDEQMIAKEQDLQLQKDTLDKAMKDIVELKKKNENLPDLRNKITLLESRIRCESQFRSTNEEIEEIEEQWQDKVEALEQRLEERIKQNEILKQKMKTVSCSDQELQELEMGLAERDQIIDELEEQLKNKDKEIAKLNDDLCFKDSTLDFTHSVLVKNQREKIELEQEKMLLEQMLRKSEEDTQSSKEKELSQFYEHQINQLEKKLQMMERKGKEKDDFHRFQMKDLKQRIRELTETILSKERRITPETMSQQETVHFLTKTLKRVVRSNEMLKILSKNSEFKDIISRLDRQFRR